MTERIVPGEEDVLLVVDIQNDFCPGGSLAVPDGHEVIPVVNRLGALFSHVVLTQDWHPPDHLSFASSHPGSRAFDTVEVDYGQQTLWPDHCVQGTPGAALHRDLAIPHAELVLRKGHHAAIDSYSAFTENDRRTRTGLAGYLRERGFRRVVLAGLAFDFCVLYSAEDAGALCFEVVVVDDACRSIDLDDSDAAARVRLARAGVRIVPSSAFAPKPAARS